MSRTTEKTKRVHIMLYESDWETLGLLYGDTVKRGQVIRTLVRSWVQKIEARKSQESRAVDDKPVIGVME